MSTYDRHPLDKNRTVPGIGPGGWNSKALAQAQEYAAIRQLLETTAEFYHRVCNDTLTARENTRRYGK